MAKYDIITALNEADLVEFVRKRIEQGWVPVGGPYYNQRTARIAQAVMRMEGAENG